jgi:SAM-dependent methyltransferase
MKVPESGMPDEVYWESLFDVNLILDRLGVDATVGNVAELGCGYGKFTLPVARRIAGVVHTFDIEPAMLARTAERAVDENVTNIRPLLRDVLAHGFGLNPASCDAVLLFNILHFPERESLIRAATQILKPEGRVLAIHWRSDLSTPRGPPLALRPKPSDATAWANSAGLRVVATPELPPWHFGAVLAK